MRDGDDTNIFNLLPTEIIGQFVNEKAEHRPAVGQTKKKDKYRKKVYQYSFGDTVGMKRTYVPYKIIICMDNSRYELKKLEKTHITSVQ